MLPSNRGSLLNLMSRATKTIPKAADGTKAEARVIRHPVWGARIVLGLAAVALLLPLALPTPAESAKVELAWTRISRATGYSVFVRYSSKTVINATNTGGEIVLPEGQAYAGPMTLATSMAVRPISVPPSALSADGLVRHTVKGLPVGPTIRFSVVAHIDGEESKPSNEIVVTYANMARVVDTDGDGLTDAEEDKNLNGIRDHGETGRNTRDSDDDGLSDGDEVFVSQSDPLDADSDDDGTKDGNDTCQDIDGDGFGSPSVIERTCPLDNCVLVSNPGQKDSDGDGFGERCDPCTNRRGRQNFFGRTSIVIRKINSDPIPGNETLAVKGDLFLPDGTSFETLDPRFEGAGLVVRSRIGDPLISETLPSGAFNGDKDTRGWRLKGRRGKVWRYADKTNSPINGIVSFKIKDMSKRDPNRIAVEVRGKNGYYPVTLDDSPVDATVLLGGTDAAAAGLCGETIFDESRCSFNRGGRHLTCK